MANIRLLHWNIETYGPTKWTNGNNPHLINYIANLVNNVNADIFAMVEVKYSISGLLPPLLMADINVLQGILPVNNPWRFVRLNSGNNNEAYIIMFRTDRNFLPLQLAFPAHLTGANVVPTHGFGYDNLAGNRVQFPGRMTPGGGRRPCYVAFQTTDTMNTFVVISYHAMFGYHTPRGIRNLPDLEIVTQFNDGPPNTLVDGTLISGDFNVDYFPASPDYANVLGLPSTAATAEETSLQNNPVGGDDPSTYRANAYDNIFQRIPMGGGTGIGLVTDLMIESAVIVGPQPAPPAAQPHTGNLSAATGAFNVVNIPNHYAVNPVATVPPANMEDSWAFVREAISNHYPVTVTTTI